RRALAATGVLSAALAAACSAPAPAETLCDPGSVVFCRCPDGEAGSKACGGDGRTFSPCRLETTGALCPDRRGPRSSTSSAGGGGSTAGVAGGGAAGAGAGAGGAAGGSQAGCPGTPLGVAFGADTSVAGDTSAGVDASADRCGGGGAREVVYEVTPAASGTLTATATGVGATDVVLYARAGDCAAGVSLGCVDAASGGGQEVLALEAVAGTSLFLFVDAAPGAGGPFSLDLHLDGGVPGDTCPGVPIAIAPGDVITAGGDTSIATANYKGTGACGASGTKEIVYAVTPSADGTLSVTLTPSFDAQLYARTGSCTSSTAGEQLGCSDAPGAGAVESLALPVAAGAAVSVFADGAAGQAGPYTISFELQ
ncbi:MAG TPA: hypothetical protein VHB21_13560, partial [Minicystis sp.]|nr:hypothetical protein [Minicystis sp.]